MSAQPPPHRFAGSWLDRAGRLRQDPAWLTAALADPGSLFAPVHGDRVLVAGEPAAGALFPDRARLTALGVDATAANTVFLGLHDGRALFALQLDAPLAVPGGEFVNLRQVGLQLPERDAGILAYAKAMLAWRTAHRYCSRSGEPLAVSDGGHVLASPAGGRVFPRVDPAIIVLVSHGERCLLGRQASWPEGRYSTIAGFVEPGESLEDAVAREVHEETNVHVTDVRYHSSQPWPFPSSLMLGFHARATSTAIRCNDAELVDARWVDRTALTGGAIRLPPPLSISYRLIEHWFDEHDGPPLAAVLAGREPA